MKKADLAKLSKEQLEEILLFMYEQMDSRAKSKKESSDKIGIEDDPGYYVYYAALKTMCSLMSAKVMSEVSKIDDGTCSLNFAKQVLGINECDCGQPSCDICHG